MDARMALLVGDVASMANSSGGYWKIEYEFPQRHTILEVSCE